MTANARSTVGVNVSNKSRETIDRIDAIQDVWPPIFTFFISESYSVFKWSLLFLLGLKLL